MKKYIICFLLFVVTSVGCVSAGYLITKNNVRVEPAIPNVTVETETVTEDRVVINQEQVEPAMSKESVYQYYLVSEDGYLLVLYQDKQSICLYTHMPIMDFPEEERSKLMEGIWFPTILEVFNYLESYTS